MKQVISKADVLRAIADLAAQSKKPTLAVLHSALGGRGSMTTVMKLKAEIESESKASSESQEALNQFRLVWYRAFEEGRAKGEVAAVELRENLAALVAENERLQGSFCAFEIKLAEAEKARADEERKFHTMEVQLLEESNRLRAELNVAHIQASAALQRLTELQSEHQSQLASFQVKLAGAEEGAHDLELKLVRALTLLDAYRVQGAPPNGNIYEADLPKSSDRLVAPLS